MFSPEVGFPFVGRGGQGISNIHHVIPLGVPLPRAQQRP